MFGRLFGKKTKQETKEMDKMNQTVGLDEKEDKNGDSTISTRKKKNKKGSKSIPKKPSNTDSQQIRPRVPDEVSNQQTSTKMDLPVGYNKAKALLVKKFVEDAMAKKVLGLIAEFRKHKRLNDYSKMVEFVAQNANGKNRYKDVGCLDNNRVILTMGPCAYIHANYVSTPNNPKKFICTQGPLPATCAEFWYMIVQESCSAILMLCNYIEMGTNKCAQYFPTKVGQTMNFGATEEIKVTAKTSDFFKFTIDTKVKIMVTQLEVQVNGNTHNTTHYHWQDWPDRGVPEADMAPIMLLAHLEKEAKAGPIVVHCSAGIGRTGSMVLIETAMEILQNNVQLEPIVGYMEELRKQRNNSVQTEHQYLYVHQVLLLYIRQKGYVDQQVYPSLDAFTKDFIKHTTGF